MQLGQPKPRAFQPVLPGNAQILSAPFPVSDAPSGDRLDVRAENCSLRRFCLWYGHERCPWFFYKAGKIQSAVS